LAAATQSALTEELGTVCSDKLDELQDPPKKVLFEQANAEARELMANHVVSFMSEDSFKQVNEIVVFLCNFPTIFPSANRASTSRRTSDDILQ
jgi:hypothetical protein